MKITLITIIILFNFLADAQYVKLHDFNTNYYQEGRYPSGDHLVFDGVFLYGVTNGGGAGDEGVIYKIKPDGTSFGVIYTFYDAAAAPFLSPLTLYYEAGFLYGMTNRGGSANGGTIFKIKTDGTSYSKLLDFNGINGLHPWGSLISDGTFLYGVLGEGGLNGTGVLFKIKYDGTNYVDLFEFNVSNCKNPLHTLVSDGNYFYGFANMGFAGDSGSIYKILPDGTGFVKLHDFGYALDGKTPGMSLIIDGIYLYGMTRSGGTNNAGTIFKMKTDGTNYSILANLDSISGRYPAGSLLYEAGYLYGMTSSGGLVDEGVIFKIRIDGAGYTQLLDFDWGTVGAYPYGSLISDGTYLYGVTGSGGSLPILSAQGTVFKFGISTGIEEKLKTEHKISVHPNPAKTNLIISIKGGAETIKVYNALGQNVYVNIMEENLNIDISTWNSGVYLVEIYDSKTNKKEMTKFIKE